MVCVCVCVGGGGGNVCSHVHMLQFKCTSYLHNNTLNVSYSMDNICSVGVCLGCGYNSRLFWIEICNYVDHKLCTWPFVSLPYCIV